MKHQQFIYVSIICTSVWE